MVIIFSFLILLDGCSGCSKSGLNRSKYERNPRPQLNTSVSEGTRQKGVVIMKKSGGVYWVPVEINGISMEFIFDTGASDITLSATEALFLYKQGKLKDDDITGTNQYQMADGTIAEGTVITLRTVKIGNRTLTNVKASVIHNLEAPLLMGQSALARFGKITIDYINNEIRFE